MLLLLCGVCILAPSDEAGMAKCSCGAGCCKASWNVGNLGSGSTGLGCVVDEYDGGSESENQACDNNRGKANAMVRLEAYKRRNEGDSSVRISP